MTGFQLAIRVYLADQNDRGPLHKSRVEQIVLAKAMEAYDGASNGNRTRGGVKKAQDM